MFPVEIWIQILSDPCLHRFDTPSTNASHLHLVCRLFRDILSSPVCQWQICQRYYGSSALYGTIQRKWTDAFIFGLKLGSDSSVMGQNADIDGSCYPSLGWQKTLDDLLAYTLCHWPLESSSLVDRKCKTVDCVGSVLDKILPYYIHSTDDPNSSDSSLSSYSSTSSSLIFNRSLNDLMEELSVESRDVQRQLCHFVMVQHLLEHGASLATMNGFPWRRAMRIKSLQLLFSFLKTPNLDWSFLQPTLEQASKEGWVDGVHVLLQYCLPSTAAEVIPTDTLIPQDSFIHNNSAYETIRTVDLRSCLREATQCGHKDLVSLFLSKSILRLWLSENNEPINQQPIVIAIRSRHSSIAKRLAQLCLPSPSLPQNRWTVFQTELLRACMVQLGKTGWKNGLCIFEPYLKPMAGVWTTLLITASSSGHHSFVQWCIDQLGDFENDEDKKEMLMPLIIECVRSTSNPDIIDLLMDKFQVFWSDVTEAYLSVGAREPLMSVEMINTRSLVVNTGLVNEVQVFESDQVTAMLRAHEDLRVERS